MAIEEQLKDALAKGNLLIGSRQVLKRLKGGELKSVIVASNCPVATRADIERNAKLSGIAFESFGGTGKQLGVVCGKPFPIAAMAILPEKKKK
jgi:large subunit ribosomal protein L30e